MTTHQIEITKDNAPFFYPAPNVPRFEVDTSQLKTSKGWQFKITYFSGPFRSGVLQGDQGDPAPITEEKALHNFFSRFNQLVHEQDYCVLFEAINLTNNDSGKTQDLLSLFNRTLHPEAATAKTITLYLHPSASNVDFA